MVTTADLPITNLQLLRSQQELHAKVDILLSQSDDLTADVTGLQADLATISASFAAELAAVAAAVAAGQPVDLTGLDAVKAQFDALATSTTPAAPAVPAAPPAS
jgi:hypothetical protein